MCLFIEPNTRHHHGTVDYVYMAKSKELCASLCMANLAKDVLLDRIANDERFWGAMAKVEQEQLNIDMSELFKGLQPGRMTNCPGAMGQEFEYKS